ncbi:GNAT family N-acetyltransferase [Halalkalicoccus salilacus]|uniref:GNAT family N-acetyltransferase n=1 Tax=Halalkalicoccus sp. GCM10025704 TaxID=3252662 RepID=UPI00361D5ACC
MALSSDARSNVRNTDEDAYEIEIGGLDEATEIIDRVRERHEEQDTPYFIDDEYISRLYTSFPDGQVKPYTCYTADGEMAGGIVAIEHDDTVYRWQGGTKVDVEIPVNDLLDWHIMEDAKSRGIKRYDLVGANQRRICRYKSKFAPDLAAYHGARKRSTRAEAVNAARGLRELVPFPRSSLPHAWLKPSTHRTHRVRASESRRYAIVSGRTRRLALRVLRLRKGRHARRPRRVACRAIGGDERRPPRVSAPRDHRAVSRGRTRAPILPM